MFSIIIPSYNRKAYIPDLLQSLEQQTAHNFEVIIVDDCSEQAVEITHFYSYPIQLIRNEQNRGAAESRNIGAAHAKREWLLFLDDDDRFALDKCEQLAKTIQANPSVNFIYHPADCLMVNENFTYVTKPFRDEAEISLESLLLANKIGGMPMICVKKSLFLQVGGLSSDLRSLEDYEFLLKLVSEADFHPKYFDMPLTQCAFHTQRASVSTHASHTEAAIKQIAARYVKTEMQRQNFAFNAAYMLAYPHVMKLSRKAGLYYFKMFTCRWQIKYLVIGLITLISPKLAVNMKRFV